MINLNTYIIEKLKLDKDTISDEYSELKEIISSSIEDIKIPYNIDSEETDVRTINGIKCIMIKVTFIEQINCNYKFLKKLNKKVEETLLSKKYENLPFSYYGIDSKIDDEGNIVIQYFWYEESK